MKPLSIITPLLTLTVNHTIHLLDLFRYHFTLKWTKYKDYLQCMPHLLVGK